MEKMNRIQTIRNEYGLNEFGIDGCPKKEKEEKGEEED